MASKSICFKASLHLKMSSKRISVIIEGGVSTLLLNVAALEENMAELLLNVAALEEWQNSEKQNRK